MSKSLSAAAASTDTSVTWCVGRRGALSAAVASLPDVRSFARPRDAAGNSSDSLHDVTSAMFSIHDSRLSKPFQDGWSG